MNRFKTEERFTYQRIKNEALNALYDFSRDLAVNKRRSHLEIIGMVSDCYENGFERPIEDVMWNCVLYILCGGWHDKQAVNLKCAIAKSIKEYGIDVLLKDIPDHEADLFKSDLMAIGLLGQV